MSDYEKALRILAYLAKMYRPAAFLEAEDILSKATGEKLDMYYRWCCAYAELL